MSGSLGIVVPSATMMQSVTSSLDVSGSLNTRRSFQRRLYDRVLSGGARTAYDDLNRYQKVYIWGAGAGPGDTAIVMAAPPSDSDGDYNAWPLSGTIAIDIASATDSEIRSYRRSSNTFTLYPELDFSHAGGTTCAYVMDYDELTPSWTQYQSGKRHGYVVGEISSSIHERDTLNAYISGTFKLENTAVAATGTLYYSKKTTLLKKTYAVTASAGLVVTPSIPTTSSYIYDFGGGRGVGFVAASGTFTQHGLIKPATFTINVPEYGRLIDIKVWVELVHDPRRPDNNPAWAESFGPLGLTVVALRPPSGDIGWMSNPVIGSGIELFGSSEFDIYYNSYILWDASLNPTNVFVAASGSEPNGVNDFNRHPETRPKWDYDMDMRVVFDDSAPVSQPGDISSLFPGGDFTQNPTSYVWTLSGSAPNAAYMTQYGSVNSLTASVYGHYFPWFADYKIKGGRLQASASWANYLTLVSGSPPPGWLTGPGGTAGTNEWPTTGSNLGPTSIRPFLPLLDDVYFIAPNTVNPLSSSDALYDTIEPLYRSLRKGTKVRKGLRGQEIHGDWKILIGSTKPPSSGLLLWDYSTGSVGVWFRQARIELTYEQGCGDNLNTRRRAFSRSGGPVSDLVCAMTGTLAIESHGVGLVKRVAQPVYGRSQGITSSTASVDFAVFSRVTGSLYSKISGSVDTFFLRNEFGTPFIPISSGSGDDAYSETSLAAIMDALDISPSVSPNQTLKAVISSTSYSKTAAQLAEELSNSSSGSS